MQWPQCNDFIVYCILYIKATRQNMGYMDCLWAETFARRETRSQGKIILPFMQ